MYMCICICMYVCMYVCLYVYIYVCLCLYVYPSPYRYDLNHRHVCHVNGNQKGDTALIWAALRGHKDIAKVLADKGADLNLQTNVSAP